MDDKPIQYFKCITAYIDLLGFSTHLGVAAGDLRTQTGKILISRLKILDNAIEKARIYISKDSLYANCCNFIIRINDAIIMGMDYFTLNEDQLEIESSYRRGDYNFEIIAALALEGASEHDNQRMFSFLGLVGLIHRYVCDEEKNIYMPGCRTTIASGIRYSSSAQLNGDAISIKGSDLDLLSANFSFSNAFIANEQGSAVGIRGSQIYIQKEVFAGLMLDSPYYAISHLLAYQIKELGVNPFTHYDDIMCSPSECFRTKPGRVKLIGNDERDFYNVNSFFLSALLVACFLYEEIDTGSIDSRSYKGKQFVDAFKEYIDSGRNSESGSVSNYTLDLKRSLPHVFLSVLGRALQLNDPKDFCQFRSELMEVPDHMYYM